MKGIINNYRDLMEYLDNQVASVTWDEFYGKRKYQAPFLMQNTAPDENLVEFLNMDIPITTAIELGCGEGRNAIYMAKQGLLVVALDISTTAIENTKNIAKQNNSNVDFRCNDVTRDAISGKYDFVYDSGLLHHLPPHRRITYIELLKSLLNP